MIMSSRFCAILALFLALALVVRCDEHSHTYLPGEEVVIWVNTVGPYSNRQERYKYSQLPYCSGDAAVQHHHETLGESLIGMELTSSGMDVKFKQDKDNAVLCRAKLSSQDIHLFRFAIENYYWYQMYLDDLPIWGFVGEHDKVRDERYLYTHRNFDIGYNDDKIIEVNLTSGKPVLLQLNDQPVDVEFTYTVRWVQSDKKFEDRFEKYLDSDFFEHKIHWFSIFNSFMMVLFLTGLVSVILLRTLRRDYARYDKEEGLGDLDHDLVDDYGWKQVHGDVFRAPPRLMLFSAIYGTGHQLTILAFAVILYTILGDLYLERATILTATIFLYALTSAFAGYTSASTYARYGGRDWIRNVLLTASLWPGVVTVLCGYVNTVAFYYNSTRAVHYTAILAMIAIWLFLVFPLTLLGAIIGRNWNGQPDFPCRVNPIPRPIPDKPWYAEPLMVIAAGGILPFGSIFIEMYFIFSSFWEYKIYYVYGFMLLVYMMLLVVSACVTIVSVYFLLNAEDHRWHWMSLLTCGSAAIYVYLYSVYYFFNKTTMNGMFQTSFYFGNTAVVCFALFEVLGYVGHTAANLFVRKIYKDVKLD
ncbi:uncharacterized protein VTP21DRAFT_9607 [Calcarisporiella thermophila]|uniref:uncharacterized protein n=1 Tax=Calcarisporiella thermophila TaxID=911321 RepID=UPI003743839E